jgi:hypothetical protein
MSTTAFRVTISFMDRFSGERIRLTNNRGISMNAKRSLLVIAAMALMTLTGSRAEAETSWKNANVSVLELPDPNHNCIFFTLVDVVEADPSIPGSPWFAIPLSQNGSAEMYNLLLRSKVHGLQIGVVTSGAPAAGCTAISNTQPIVGITYLYLL